MIALLIGYIVSLKNIQRWFGIYVLTKKKMKYLLIGNNMKYNIGGMNHDYRSFMQALLFLCKYHRDLSYHIYFNTISQEIIIF